MTTKTLREQVSTLRHALRTIRSFAESHHSDQQAHELLHALKVDIPEFVRVAIGSLPDDRPLRRVTGVDRNTFYEQLECGHQFLPPMGGFAKGGRFHMGSRPAQRRRCSDCAPGAN